MGVDSNSNAVVSLLPSLTLLFTAIHAQIWNAKRQSLQRLASIKSARDATLCVYMLQQRMSFTSHLAFVDYLYSFSIILYAPQALPHAYARGSPT